MYTRKKESKHTNMNTFGSELRSSGCESGWPLYLDFALFFLFHYFSNKKIIPISGLHTSTL